jgi:SanA protein
MFPVRPRFRRYLWIIATLCIFGVVSLVLLNSWIVRTADSRVYANFDALPENEVGLVLGAARLTGNGSLNPHFEKRIQAAAVLYRAGKVEHLLLSGDNHIKTYDEPTDMKNALLSLGVPESAMTLDYAGFRTFDSVVRARKVFGQQKLTLITDDFHAYRAVFLCEHNGIDAVAYCSDRVSLRWSARSRVRELLARAKAALDVYVLPTHPRFLGPVIEIKVGRERKADTNLLS